MTVTVCKHTCEAGALYQWDRGQTLRIVGLSLDAAPEVHFVREGASHAIIRQASMDSSGVISASIPDEVLERAGALHVYVCQSDGDEFSTLYDFSLAVRGRARPGS